MKCAGNHLTEESHTHTTYEHCYTQNRLYWAKSHKPRSSRACRIPWVATSIGRNPEGHHSSNVLYLHKNRWRCVHFCVTRKASLLRKWRLESPLWSLAPVPTSSSWTNSASLSYQNGRINESPKPCVSLCSPNKEAIFRSWDLSIISNAVDWLTKMRTKNWPLNLAMARSLITQTKPVLMAW